ncbi:MAG: GcrA family cell cycle regulator, partial [Stellaceae bacterium]
MRCGSSSPTTTRGRTTDPARQSCPQTRKSIGERRPAVILYLVAGGCGATAYGGDPMESIWTPERITQLSQLWKEGHSTAEIGRRIGVTKNAVVGKAHRL